jgi:hypothetical protein
LLCTTIKFEIYMLKFLSDDKVIFGMILGTTTSVVTMWVNFAISVVAGVLTILVGFEKWREMRKNRLQRAAEEERTNGND